MRKRIVTTSAVIAGLLLVGGGTAIAVTNSNNTVPVSEKSDKVVSVPVVEHANTEAKSSSASPSPSASASEKAAAEAKAAEVTAGATVANTNSGGAEAAPVVDAAQNGGEYYGTPVEFNPNAPRYDLQHGGNPYATYDQSQSDATATSGLTDASANAGMTTTNPSQITVTYPGQ